MGHTGLARLCLGHWYYRTRTKPTEVREAPTSTGGGGCHGCIIVEWQAVLRLDSGKEVKYMDSCDSAGRSMICGGSKKILTWLNVDFIFSYA